MTIRQDLLQVNNGQSIRTFNVDGAHINAKPIQFLTYKEYNITGLEKLIDAVDSDIFISKVQRFNSTLPSFGICKINEFNDPNIVKPLEGSGLSEILLPKGYTLYGNNFSGSVASPTPRTARFLLFFESIYLEKE